MFSLLFNLHQVMAGRLRKLIHNNRGKEFLVVDWTALGDVVILGEMLRTPHL